MQDTDPSQWSQDERDRVVTDSRLYYAFKAYEHKVAMKEHDAWMRRSTRAWWIFIAFCGLVTYTLALLIIIRDHVK